MFYLGTRPSGIGEGAPSLASAEGRGSKTD
jgi:hypothetical protein